eukprot:16040-Heterococcus_DN1.PRE.1
MYVLMSIPTSYHPRHRPGHCVAVHKQLRSQQQCPRSKAQKIAAAAVLVLAVLPVTEVIAALPGDHKSHGSSISSSIETISRSQYAPAVVPLLAVLLLAVVVATAVVLDNHLTGGTLHIAITARAICLCTGVYSSP